MKTKNFDEFLNEENLNELHGTIDTKQDLDKILGQYGSDDDGEDEDEEFSEDPITYDYDKILDIINSNSPEEAAEIISKAIHEICMYR